MSGDFENKKSEKNSDASQGVLFVYFRLVIITLTEVKKKKKRSQSEIDPQIVPGMRKNDQCAVLQTDLGAEEAQSKKKRKKTESAEESLQGEQFFKPLYPDRETNTHQTAQIQSR